MARMHNIRLPEATVEHVTRRRGGRLHAYDAIDARRAALLVIDMQNYWCRSGMPAYSPCSEGIAPNINRLAAATRGAGGSVWWIRAIYSDAPKDWPSYMGYLGAGDVSTVLEHLTDGHPGADIWDGMDVRQEDEIAVKTRFSAFIRGASDIEDRLRARDVDMLIVTGIATDVCVESTVRDAFMLGFPAIVVSDATATRSDAAHNASLGAMFNHFADVFPTEEVTAMLQRSAAAAAE
jgi:ureidoacrylate peracid hydrolase